MDGITEALARLLAELRGLVKRPLGWLPDPLDRPAPIYTY